MIDNLILSINVVLPLFLEMILGYYLRRKGMIDQPSAKKMNKLVFSVFMPMLLFYNIYNTDLSVLSAPTFLIFAMVSAFAEFLFLMIVIPRIIKDNKKCGAFIQACFRSNYILFGIPMVTLIVGEAQAGVASLMAAVIVPEINVLAVITLERFRGGKPTAKSLIRSIFANPLIVATLIAIPFNLLKYFGIFSIPQFAYTALQQLSRLATPLALVVLGADFRLDALKNYWKLVAWTSALKLLIFPAILLTIAALIGIRGPEFVTVMIYFGAPTAVGSYTMAEIMDSDGVLAGQSVFYSTAASIVTLFILIFVTKTLGMF